MFWKIFSSERRVQEALDQSIGYDISPNILHMPANAEPAPAAESLQHDLWKDYAYVMPANTQGTPSRFEEPWERKKA